MEENKIEIVFSGNSGNQPAGGGGQPRPPAGSRQDTQGEPDIRQNRDLDDLFGVASTAPEPVRHDEGGDRRQEFLNRKIQEEHDRRQRVQQGLAGQKAAEEEATRREQQREQRRQQKEAERVKREEERERKREEAELNADLRRQYRKQREQERRQKQEERDLNADLKRQYDAMVRRGKEGQRLQEKAAKEAAQAEQNQRLKYIQAGQAAQQIGSGTPAGVGGGLINLAQTGFLGKEAAAMAGGPVGGAVMAGLMIKEAVEGVIKSTYAGYREAIQGAANVGSSVINNDFQGAAGQATEALAGFAEKTGIVGVVFAEQMRTAAAITGAFNQVMDAAVKRGRELERFSPGIGAAAGRADMRRELADLREADAMGEDYASLIDSQSRIEDAQRAAFEPIKEALVSVLADIAELVADSRDDILPAVRGIAKIVGFVIKTEAAFALFPFQLLIRILEYIPKVPGFGGLDDRKHVDLLDQVRDAMNNIRNGPESQVNPNAEPDRVNRMKAPAFFGGR